MGVDYNNNNFCSLSFLRKKEAVFSGCSLFASLMPSCDASRLIRGGNKNPSQRVLYHTQENGSTYSAKRGCTRIGSFEHSRGDGDSASLNSADRHGRSQSRFASLVCGKEGCCIDLPAAFSRSPYFLQLFCLVLVGRALKLISHNAVALVEFIDIHFSRILFPMSSYRTSPIEKSRRSWHACVRQGSMGPLSSEDQSFGLSRLFMLLHTIGYVISIGADPA